MDETTQKGSGVTPSDETPGHPFFTTLGIVTRFADKIIPLFPEKFGTYVEPFCGNVEMLWCHPRRATKLEAVNDLDADIVRLHKLCQGFSDAQLASLEKDYDWVGDEAHFKSVVKAKTPSSDLAWFQRELYIRRFSKHGREGAQFRKEDQGTTANPFKRIARCRARLQDVRIEQLDYRKAFAKYDGSDTFWFIEPPYPDEGGYYKIPMPDMAEQADQYDKLKGKAMFVIEGSDKALAPMRAKGWTERRFKWPRGYYHMPSTGPKVPYVLASIFMNFTPASRARTGKLAKQRIAEVMPQELVDVSDEELLSLDQRIHQLHGSNFEGNDHVVVGKLHREDLVNTAVCVWEEMRQRAMDVSEDTAFWCEAQRLTKSDHARETVRRYVDDVRSRMDILLDGDERDELVEDTMVFDELIDRVEGRI
jgi:DNA adenine methylase